MLSIKSLCFTTDTFDVCLILDALQCATLTCETEDEIDMPL